MTTVVGRPDGAGVAGPDPGPGARPGLTAAAAVVADRAAGRPRIRWTHAWPIVLRPTGPRTVHLVHGAGGPLGGDVLSLAVQVEAGAALAVRSAGATIVQPGSGDAWARWDTTATVGAAGTLDWAPEPTVVTDRAAFATSLRVDLAAGATACVREVVVLGRHGQRGGRYRGRLEVTVDGVALIAHETRLDGADPALSGLGGTAGARAVGTLVVVGGRGAGAFAEGVGRDAEMRAEVGEEPRVRWAWTELAGPGRALFAVGDAGAVVARLEAAAATAALIDGHQTS